MDPNPKPFHCECGKTFDTDVNLTLHRDQKWCMKEAAEYADAILQENGDFQLLGPSQLSWFNIKLRSGFGAKPVKVLLFGETHQTEKDMLPKEYPCIRMANFLKYLVDHKQMGFRVLGETPLRYAALDFEREWNFYRLNSTLRSFSYFPLKDMPNFLYRGIDYRQCVAGHDMTIAVDQIADTEYRHQYTRSAQTTTIEQKLDLEINAGRLVAEFYGLKMKFSADAVKTSHAYQNSQSFQNHGAIMDYPALALLDQLIADKTDTRPIIIYAGWWHTSVYQSIFLDWSTLPVFGEADKPYMTVSVRDIPKQFSSKNTLKFSSSWLKELNTVVGPKMADFPF